MLHMLSEKGPKGTKKKWKKKEKKSSIQFDSSCAHW